MNDIIGEFVFQHAQLQLPFGFGIQHRQPHDQYNAHQNQIPVAQQFHTNHVANVAFVAELLKDR